MYICICKSITDKDIKQALNDGAKTTKDLSEQLGVIRQCGRCAQSVKKIVKGG